MNDAAVSALYSALAAVALPKSAPDVADIAADRRFTESVAIEYAARLELGRRNQAKIAAFYAKRGTGSI